MTPTRLLWGGKWHFHPDLAEATEKWARMRKRGFNGDQRESNNPPEKIDIT